MADESKSGITIDPEPIAAKKPDYGTIDAHTVEGGELRKDVPTWVRIGEDWVLKPAAMIGGGALGAFLGSGVPGPGTLAGGAVGAGLGMEGADYLSAKINHGVYGTPIDTSPEALRESTRTNLIASTAAELLTPVVGSALKQGVAGAFGMPSLAAGAAEKAEETGTANLVERADAYQAANTAQQNMGRAAEEAEQTRVANIAKKSGEAAGEETKATEEAAKAQLPQARAAEIEKALNPKRPPEEPEVTASGASLPSPELTARRVRMGDAVHGILKKSNDEISAQYDARLKDYMDKSIPVGQAPTEGAEGGGLRAALAKKEAFNAEHKIEPPPAVKGLLAKVKNVGDAGGGEAEWTKYGITQDQWENTSDYDRDTIRSYFKTVRPSNASSAEMAAARKGKTLEPQPTWTAKVAALKGFRSQASGMVANDSTGTAKAIQEAIEKSFEDAGIPGVKDLNARLRTQRLLADRSFFKSVSNAADPVEYAGDIFNDKHLAPQLYDGADASQKAALRELYTDWYFDNKGKIVDWDKQGQFLKRAFAGTSFGTENTWVHLDDKILNATELMGKQPELAANIQARYEQIVKDEGLKAAKDIVAAVDREVPKLNQIRAQQIYQAIHASSDPMEQAAVAMKIIPQLTPESEVANVAGRQMSPNTAATNALQQGYEGKAGSLVRTLRSRGPLYLAATAFSLGSRGAASPYMAAMAGLAVADTTSRGLQKALVWAVGQNTEWAQALLAAFNKPGSAIGRSMIAKSLAGAATSNIAEHYGLGNLEKEPEPSVNDVAVAPAVKNDTGVRAGRPGESHKDIEHRTGSSGEDGFIDKGGKFIKRDDAHSAVKALGGTGGPPHSGDIKPNPAPTPPEPVSLGDSPMRQAASQMLSKNPKAVAQRDYEDAARQYRKGDIAALDAKSWMEKGLTAQDLADGWRRSTMNPVKAGLSQLKPSELARMYQMADNDADKKLAKTALVDKIRDTGWENLAQNDKKTLAPLIRKLYAPDREDGTGAAITASGRGEA